MKSPKKPPKRYITNMLEKFVGDVHVLQLGSLYKAKGYDG